MDVETRWLTGLGVAVALVVGAIGAVLVSCPLLGGSLTALLAGAAIVWGKWPHIRARYPAIERGITWTRKPRPDGIRLEISSSRPENYGIVITGFGGGEVQIFDLKASKPVSEGKRLVIRPGRARVTKGEIVIPLYDAQEVAGPAGTITLDLLTTEQLNITGIRHLRPGDLDRLNWIPR